VTAPLSPLGTACVVTRYDDVTSVVR
jgi:hypothetical protein